MGGGGVSAAPGASAGWIARWFGEILLVGAVAFNLVILRAERLVVAYPNDSSVHLQMVEVARYLLVHGRFPLDQWYPHLSLGSPFFVQYQSLSAILVGLTALVLPATQVFAWSLYLLLALWPVAVYIGARLMGLDRVTAGVAAAMAPLLSSVTARGFGDQSYDWLGPGLWSQLWAMWSLPLAWGFSWRWISRRRYLAGAVLAGAATIELHFLTAYLVGLSIVVITVLARRDLAGRAARAAVLGVLALGASLFVSVPLLADYRFTAVNEFQVGTTIDNSYGARLVLRWLAGGRLLDWGHVPVLTIALALGLVVAVVRWGKDEQFRVLLGLFVLSLLLFFGRTTFGSLLKVLPGSGQLLFQRYVMGVQLAGILLGAAGLVVVVRWLARRWSHVTGTWAEDLRMSPLARRSVAPLALVVVVALLFPAAAATASYAADNAQSIATQRTADSGPGDDVAQIAATVERLGGGRVYAGMPSNWGRYFFVGEVPVYIYLSDLGVDLVGFTLRTSSLMTGPEAYFDQDDLADYVAFGVDYLVMPGGTVPPVPARLVERRGPYDLYRVAGGRLVQVADTIGPPIRANGSDLGARTRGFLAGDLAARDEYRTVAFGGTPAAPPTRVPGVQPGGPPGRVLSVDAHLSLGRLETTVVAHRRSVVVLKVAFDPGWHVTVDGRRARTIMVAPALVGVVVAPGRHHVAFTFEGYAGYPVLWGLSALSVAVAVLAPAWWRRRAVRGREPVSPGTSTSVSP